ncbi:MAG: hypothetical protein Q7I99_09335 [Acholeplasmataceae bacterium]|nr:hypothetical protein [Acholeplasmataceae bacterium]
MKPDIFKRILQSITNGILESLKWIWRNQQVLVYVSLLIVASLYFVYTLGYSSNWALVVSDTRGQRFYRASQTANRLLFDLGFFLIVVVLFTLGVSSMSRKKFYLSNIVLSISSSILLIVSAALTLYYNSVLRGMYERITEEEVPAYLYVVHGAGAKSYQVFDTGNILAVFMFITAVLVLLFLFRKIRAQKERAKLIEKLVTNHEH